MATTQNKAGGSKKVNQRDVKPTEKLVSDNEILTGSPLDKDQQIEKNSSLSIDQQSISKDQENISTDEQRRERISLAAYYNAEKRGFSGDFQLEDWLEAEKQVGNYQTGGTANNRDQLSVQQSINQTDAVLDDVDARSSYQEVIDPSEIKRWAEELGASATELREAISRVGSKVEDVRNFLVNNGTKH